MTFDRLFSEILLVCQRMDIEVRLASLGGEGGGLCEVRGRRFLYVDAESDMATRVDRCLHIIAACPDVEQVFIPPSLRQRISEILESP